MSSHRINKAGTFYLASPGRPLQLEACVGRNVLMSFTARPKNLWHWAGAFKSLILDSGAFSAYNSGQEVVLEEYREWALQYKDVAAAIAGLDDIGGDWRQSMDNYEAFPEGFPTFHDSDPYDLLDDLICMARERGGYLGLGLTLPRKGKRAWVVETLDRIPNDIVVHGFALAEYAKVGGFDSFDSTGWMRYAHGLKAQLFWLTEYECVEIAIKWYERRWQKGTKYMKQQGGFFS